MFGEPPVLNRLAISGTEYPHRPLSELLDVAIQLGVSNLELWIPHNFVFEEIGEVERELTRRGLSAAVISTWTQLNLPGDIVPRQTLIRQSIEAAKILRAGSVNTYFGAHPNRTPEESVQCYREAILPLVEMADKEGIFISLENEFETTGRDVTRSANGVLSVLEAVAHPAFKANFDPCNFYFAGEEPYPYAYELLKDHIGYIHLKDGMKYRPGFHPDPGEGFLWKDKSGDYVCCPMGMGAINFIPMLRKILESGYGGYLAFEPHVRPPMLLTTFRHSVQFVRQLMLR
jgi:sugar phosphate isomerase/epimerase